jgi:hypothetical protein
MIPSYTVAVVPTLDGCDQLHAPAALHPKKELRFRRLVRTTNHAGEKKKLLAGIKPRFLKFPASNLV